MNCLWHDCRGDYQSPENQNPSACGHNHHSPFTIHYSPVGAICDRPKKQPSDGFAASSLEREQFGCSTDPSPFQGGNGADRCRWQSQGRRRPPTAVGVQSATERSEALSAALWQRSKKSRIGVSPMIFSGTATGKPSPKKATLSRLRRQLP